MRDLESQILKQGLTPERAKLLFSIVVGPLPGVTLPFPTHNDVEFDGTLAVTYLYRVWDSLTPEQKRAAYNLIHPPEGNNRSASAFRFALIPPAYADNIPAFNYTKLASDADGAIEALLGITGVKFKVPVNYGQPPGSEYAHTWSWYGSNDPKNPPTFNIPLGYCEITVNDQLFHSLSQTDAQGIITHEMFHCFQDRQAGSPQNMLSLHPWISEGEASWVMSEIVPAFDPPDILLPGGVWRPYVENPSTVYSDRAYDGVGVFGHLTDLTGASYLWPKLLPLVQTGLQGNDLGAFNSLIAGNELDYFNTWGADRWCRGIWSSEPRTMFTPLTGSRET